MKYSCEPSKHRIHILCSKQIAKYQGLRLHLIDTTERQVVPILARAIGEQKKRESAFPQAREHSLEFRKAEKCLMYARV